MKQNPAEAAFSHLLLSGTFVHEASFSEMQQTYGIYIHPHLVMAISIDRYPDLSIEKPLNWRIEIGQRLVEAIYKAVTIPFVWVWIEEGVLALLLEFTSEHRITKDLNEETLQIAKKIQKSADEMPVSVSIGIGTYYDDPYMLQHSYKEARKSMINRFFQGNRMIFQFEKEKNREESGQNYFSLKEKIEKERIELLARVRIGDVDGTVPILQIILEGLAEANKFNVNMFKSEVVDLVMMISRLVLEAGFSAETILSENAHFIQDLYQTIRYDKFIKKVCEYVRWLTEQVALTQTLEVSPVIRQAIRYMKENLRKKISLEDIAQYCCLSKYHLSHLFKKEIGVSVIDFLNKIRIEKAIYYLETTDLSIQQIADKVGFPDANYFSRTFKKYTQHSPTKYRSARLC
ncbi:helix-turn-helix domain-containing protein [Aneurinibacillus thermoaerophilus]|uniref:Helix-turn-helix domain-containing protein n=1 Tax=Aneurinibacillus thermoaerophilus TaxID=143495 RepID=A0A1G8EC96_ANETH|nr:MULTISPECIES: helix-turn-helix domain-containing protein [Aneurinibacillus]AMA72398.1 AraC family transcriptional regulator [Aneurinibacillus sp. XH2]MED0676345.1 helix-turn-helix domain-containing protein [Aneurinibacillus thermoaerophilus]MED0759025.1 helix-turn-helix domain-containing protein [Aneurinibacillus thermoaerophilus]MED0762686.1 helix-turn-helix domain-containing protein [Aneurinibacillus thermoaerophilus]QYY41845.1 helix-turn-helix domain-containing protein [Aneurinibacillus 